MPDGLTHVAASYIGLNKWLSKGQLGLFLVGSLLPDIILRGGRLFFVGQPQRDFLELYLTPFHTPFIVFFVCLGLSQFFYHKIRHTALFLLFLGCIGHFFLDFLQKTIEGSFFIKNSAWGYKWFFPFSWVDIQFGLFWAEDAPYALLILLPISVFIFIYNMKKH